MRAMYRTFVTHLLPMVSRIKQLLDWQQLSPTQFADRIGIGRPVISHILSERNKPSLDVVQRILAAFPELSTNWLIKGEGEMLAASEPAVPATPPAPVVPPEAAPVVTVPTPTVVPAAPFRPAPAPTPPTAIPVPAVPAAAVQPIEPVAQAPVPKAAPRPAIARFAPTKASAAPPAPATEPPATSTTVAQAAAPEPANHLNQAASDPAATPVSLDEALTPPPVPASAPIAPAVPAKAAPTLADVFGESGKAIRRIVIFYRDGSFADYQPEG